MSEHDEHVNETGDRMRGMDRRRFLGQAAQVAAFAGLGAALAQGANAQDHVKVTPVDQHTPKTGRLVKPEEPIGLAVIGVGGQGGSHFEDYCTREKKGGNLRMQAVCDVYAKRLNKWKTHAAEITGHSVDTCMDYRQVLERDDVHAVVIATPDHWHAQISMDAMDAGKDVYCEKPMTLTIEEALAVRDKVFETGRIFQCGANAAAKDWCWQARKVIQEGGIGKVLWAQASCNRNSAGGPDDRGGEWNWPIDAAATDDPNAGENYIDWKRWLGSARPRPFSKPRFFQFRKFWEYNGGIATDLMYHVLAPLTIALDAKAPERATGSGGIFVQHDDREVPDTFMVTLDYPDDYTVVMTSTMANRQVNPVVIYGHRGTIRITEDGALTVTPEKEFKDWFKEKYGVEELAVTPAPRDDIRTSWFNAIRSREGIVLDAETAYRTMAGIKMAVDSYRQERMIFWDHAKETYVATHPRPNRSSSVPAEEA